MQILELYSGIGGMHMAFKESCLPGHVKAAIEINPTANLIYQHNFPHTKLLNLNIEGLSVEFVNNLGVDTILMSPPCQPFTRNGKKADIEDARTDSFQHVLSLLPHLQIEYILIENVKGFEQSEMRNILIKTLSDNKFTYQEFLLSPVQFGIPNSRLRYYCIARRLPYQFCFENDGQLRKTLPEVSKICQSEIVQIQDILDDDLDMTSYYLTDSILRKRLKILDICFRNSRKSCCFTKAYGRFIEGTGSVFTNRLEEEVTPILQKLYSMDCKSETYILLARSLNLRFFTPKEISKLMCFPKTFSFPNDLTQRQKYMVLGNSVNVRVVTELIKLFQA